MGKTMTLGELSTFRPEQEPATTKDQAQNFGKYPKWGKRVNG